MNALAAHLINSGMGFLLEQPVRLAPMMSSSGKLEAWMFQAPIIKQCAPNEIDLLPTLSTPAANG